IIENWFELLDSWFNEPDNAELKTEESRAETDADKKDKEKLQGTWYVVSAESGGEENPDIKKQKHFLAIKGDEFSIRRGDEVMVKGTFKVDSSKKPKIINMKVKEGSKVNDDDEAETARGIYKLEGDELTWCVNEPGSGNRPKEFATKEGTKIMLFKLKREKK